METNRVHHADQTGVRPGDAGERPLGPVDYDAELRLHNDVLRRAYDIHPRDRVLDIGCGTGQTTRDAARRATDGSALGIDISAEMIERAREIVAAETMRNVTFEVADAAVHPLVSEHFDVVISRFGTMFFVDPVAAFRNIARAVRPAGRLMMMVWREHERNEWSVATRRSLTGSESAPIAPPGTPDPFSLADPKLAEQILSAALALTPHGDVHYRMKTPNSRF